MTQFGRFSETSEAAGGYPEPFQVEIPAVDVSAAHGVVASSDRTEPRTVAPPNEVRAAPPPAHRVTDTPPATRDVPQVTGEGSTYGDILADAPLVAVVGALVPGAADIATHHIVTSMARNLVQASTQQSANQAPDDPLTASGKRTIVVADTRPGAIVNEPLVSDAPCDATVVAGSLEPALGALPAEHRYDTIAKAAGGGTPAQAATFFSILKNVGSAIEQLNPVGPDGSLAPPDIAQLRDGLRVWRGFNQSQEPADGSPPEITSLTPPQIEAVARAITPQRLQAVLGHVEAVGQYLDATCPPGPSRGFVTLRVGDDENGLTIFHLGLAPGESTTVRDARAAALGATLVALTINTPGGVPGIIVVKHPAHEWLPGLVRACTEHKTRLVVQLDAMPQQAASALAGFAIAATSMAVGEQAPAASLTQPMSRPVLSSFNISSGHNTGGGGGFSHTVAEGEFGRPRPGGTSDGDSLSGQAGLQGGTGEQYTMVHGSVAQPSDFNLHSNEVVVVGANGAPAGDVYDVASGQAVRPWLKPADNVDPLTKLAAAQAEHAAVVAEVEAMKRELAEAAAARAAGAQRPLHVVPPQIERAATTAQALPLDAHGTPPGAAAEATTWQANPLQSTAFVPGTWIPTHLPTRGDSPPQRARTIHDHLAGQPASRHFDMIVALYQKDLIRAYNIAAGAGLAVPERAAYLNTLAFDNRVFAAWCHHNGLRTRGKIPKRET